MQTGFRLLLKFCLFMLFVWLVKEFWGLLEVDGCLDGGGRIEGQFCIPEQHKAWAMASQRHYSSWFLVLGLPAAGVWLLHAAIAHLISLRRHKQ